MNGSVLSSRLAAIESAGRAGIYEAWDELNDRRWPDTQINKAIAAASNDPDPAAYRPDLAAEVQAYADSLSYETGIPVSFNTAVAVLLRRALKDTGGAS